MTNEGLVCMIYSEHGNAIGCFPLERYEALIEVAVAAQAYLDDEGFGPAPEPGEDSYVREYVRQWGEHGLALATALLRLNREEARESGRKIVEEFAEDLKRLAEEGD